MRKLTYVLSSMESVYNLYEKHKKGLKDIIKYCDNSKMVTLYDINGVRVKIEFILGKKGYIEGRDYDEVIISMDIYKDYSYIYEYIKQRCKHILEK